MGKFSNTTEFIGKAIKVHSFKYTYENVNYQRAAIKVHITCPTHGLFWQKPADHLSNHGCPECKADKIACKWKDILGEFLNSHCGHYTYDETTYIRNSVKMKIYCPVHGEFWQKPELHKKGAGCKICTANAGPGRYCDSLFKKRPELKSVPGVLYHLELNDEDGTKFYKIGMTMNLHTRYYNFIKQNNGRICWVLYSDLYTCFQKEKSLLQDYKMFKYVPIIGQVGKTECLTREIPQCA